MSSVNGTLTKPGPALYPLADATPAPAHHKSGTRELVETLVFVTVLVLLLRSFIAEAFVIPTGSMAETLLGYRAYVTCPECNETFPVNVSEEIEPNKGAPQPIEGCTCPNCRLHIKRTPKDDWVRFPAVVWNSGDRVLVAKWPFQEYRRWDVVVFKYPNEPVQRMTAMNYIKRLVGLPGDTIAILNGDLFVCRDINYNDQQLPERELDRWKSEYMYADSGKNQKAQEAFKAGRFTILRKPPDHMMAMRRPVYDNEHQAKDLAALPNSQPRWQHEAGWQPDNEKMPKVFRRDADAPADSWVRYQHLMPPWHENRELGAKEYDTPRDRQPSVEFINNMAGYNWPDTSPFKVDRRAEDRSWVGDLMLECDVDVQSSAGEFVLELSKGTNRFQARFNLATGECTLLMIGKVSTQELAKKATKLKGPGKHFIRFANFDERLTLWVDNELPFGDGQEYVGGDRSDKPDNLNDHQPASFGTLGGARLSVSKLRLFRDTYYTKGRSMMNTAEGEADMTMFVQPGHYLCMGDNSTQSSDGRDWGTVPERLMLGKALMVYFPIWPFAPRFGPIR